MPRRGEYGDPTPRCAYCGKPEIKPIWSNFRKQYCSHKCMAAGEYHMNLICGICFVPIALLMSMGFVLGLVMDPLSLDATYIFFMICFDFVGFYTLYTVYIGSKMSYQ